MNNLTIKLKLILLAVFVAIGFAIVIIVENHDIDELGKLSTMEKDIKDLNIHMLTLRKHEKDFLARKDLKYLGKFKKTIQDIDMSLKNLNKGLIHFDLDTKAAQKYENIIQQYSKIFQEVIQTQQTIGLNPKDGLYGTLRASVHKVQDYAKKSNDTNLLSIVYDLRKQEKDFMLRYDLKYLDKYNKKIDKLLANQGYKDMKSLLLSYKKDFNTLVELEVKKGLNSNLGLMGNMRKVIHTSTVTLKELTTLVQEAIVEKTFAIKVSVISISVVIALFVILILLYISRQIALSLKDFETGLVGFFSFVNNESKEVQPLHDKDDDEIGRMAKLINKNIQTTQDNIEKDRAVINNTINVLSDFEQGDLHQRITITSSNESLKELTTILNKMAEKLEENFNEILNVLQEYTHDNYLNRVSTNGLKEHLLNLAEGVNAVGDASTDSLVQRKRNGLTLQNNALVLKDNVDNLSSSASEAAASLEETAAALEEITSTIISNSENVNEMAKYATLVTESASSGENLANNTMDAMDNINNQVSSINEAITVIDQIAFQTNILSLNAAVEAATAGEAGKGFAVVAQEVRNLATRSAEAAKEIKSIVETATVKADAGKKIAGDMLQGYKGLNEHIEKTIKLIDFVSTASKEQQTGIEQINGAVTQIDQQTQKNSAAAVETNEIAITTEKLAETILSGVNKNQFNGKEDVKDRRSKVNDLNYAGSEKRRAEAEIKATSNPKKEKVSKKVDVKESKIKESKKVEEKVSEIKEQEKENNIITSKDSDDEWESF